MLNELLYPVIAVMAVAVIIVLGLVVRYPLKVLHRWVRCPLVDRPAQVGFLRREVQFGQVESTDVSSCSLFGEDPVTCGKECLPQGR